MPDILLEIARSKASAINDLVSSGRELVDNKKAVADYTAKIFEAMGSDRTQRADIYKEADHVEHVKGIQNDMKDIKKLLSQPA